MKIEEFLNHNASVICGQREIDGEKFGVELELEGRNVAMADVATRGWNRHQEPSLRGEAIEYTTSGAIPHEETKKRVSELFAKFKEHKVNIKDSLRTSTHVHLNFSSKPLKQALNFFVLFTVLEELLQYYSGEDRKGNLFCISSREAEGIIGILMNSVRNCNLANFAGDRYKYAACNLSTLYKFGTIEVRTMKGATSADQINNWLDILNDMYEYSCKKMKSPAQLVNDLSMLGAEGFMKSIFQPANYKELMSHFPAVATLHYSLMEGARLVQMFAFEFEDEFNAVVEVKVVEEKKAKKKGPLRNLPNGRFAIYRPDGERWTCFKHDGGAFEDGDPLSDCKTIYWNAMEYRFMFMLPEGAMRRCRWANGPGGEDEGPPPRDQRIATHIVMRDQEEDDDDDWAEFEEHDEGDDF
jgi:hypothetical protein